MSNVDLNSTSSLSGIIDVFLVDKETKKIVKHVRKKNQITEAFARWVLAGNLGTPNSGYVVNTGSSNNNTITQNMSSNPISVALSSKCVAKYQTIFSVAAGAGGGSNFGIYLLDTPTRVLSHTQIPQYTDASLTSAHPAVAFYGTYDTEDEGPYTMSMNDGGSKWTTIGSPPGHMTTYMKTDGTATVHSIIFGAFHGGRGYLSTLQSPAVLPSGWDNTWAGFNAAGSSTQLGSDVIKNEWLLAPFSSKTTINSRRGTCMYAVSLSGGSYVDSGNYYMGFYDLSSKQFEFNTAAEQKTNGLTSEKYQTNTGAMVPQRMWGGISIGNGKVIRVDKGADTSTNRQININFTTSLTNASDNTALNTVSITLRPHTSLSGSASIPEAIYTRCSPVMAACPYMVTSGDSNSADRIDVFISMGVGRYKIGEHTLNGETQDIIATGVEIQRIRLKVNNIKSSASKASDLLLNLPTYIENLTSTEDGSGDYYGELVAVIPYAIGQDVGTTNGGITPNGSQYLQGYYDNVEDEYYLPFTHILQGVDTNTWTFDSTKPQATTLLPCGDNVMHYGAVFEADNAFERDRDFMFGVDGRHIIPCVTDEGLVPLTVNSTQRRSASVGRVLSGVILDAPITKLENQILVVQYSYLFDIIPIKPLPPNDFEGISTAANVIELSWVVAWASENQTITDFTFQYRKASSLVWVGREDVTAISTGCILRGLEDACMYICRIRTIDSGQKSLWSIIAVTTLPVSPLELDDDPTDSTTIIDVLYVEFIIPKTLIENNLLRYCTFEVKKSEDPDSAWKDVNVIAAWKSITVETVKSDTVTSETDIYKIVADEDIKAYYNGLEPETDYDFRLTAHGYHSSAPSNVVTRKTKPMPFWASPTIDGELTHNFVTIAWDPISGGEYTYTLYRILTDGSLSTKGTITTGTSGTFDNNLTSDIALIYKRIGLPMSAYNLPVPQEVVASSQPEGTAYQAYRIFDDNETGTFWRSNTSYDPGTGVINPPKVSEYVQIDLGQDNGVDVYESEIDAFTISRRRTSNDYNYPVNYTLSAANNADGPWFTLATIKDAPWVVNGENLWEVQHVIDYLPDDYRKIPYRYFRLSVSKIGPANNGYVEIAELKLWKQIQKRTGDVVANTRQTFRIYAQNHIGLNVAYIDKVVDFPADPSDLDLEQ
jgi:hypothetical protein